MNRLTYGCAAAALALAAALGDDEWDAVVDTWSLAPRVVRDSEIGRASCRERVFITV